MKARSVAASLLACGLLASGAAVAATQTIKPSNVWPQAHSDIPADPAVTFGTLPNGMRYLIRHNENPAHTISLAFRVASGSLEETPRERGLSHFVEHMAFRGSKHFADNEMMKTLESLGAARGTDSNAFTLPDNTIFTFEVPRNDGSTLDKALGLCRDIASELTFDPKATESERAVVLAELRQKDTVARRQSIAGTKAVLGENLAAGIDPGGLPSVVQNAKPAELRRFYRAHYRPEWTTLVIVGDVEVKTVEAEIKARFSNWKAKAPRPAPQAYTMPDPLQAPLFQTFSETGAAKTVALSWAQPYDSSPDMEAKAEHEIVRGVALSVLNLRLQKLAQRADPPFLGAGASSGSHFGVADVAAISLTYGPKGPAAGLKAAHAAYLEAAQGGVRQDEIDQVVSQWRTLYQATVVAVKNLPDGQWKATYIAALGLNRVIIAPEVGQKRFENAVKNLAPAQITSELKTLFASHEPAVFVSSPEPLTGVDADSAAAFAATVPALASTAPAPASAPVVWPYTDFGPAGKLAGQPQAVADLGATFVTFANNVRATIKPTKFLPGQVEISVHIGDGQIGLPKDRKVPSWALAGTYMGGGLKRLSPDDLPKALTGKEWGVTMMIGPGAFLLSGETRTDDFLTELQVLTAYTADPAWRPQAFLQAQSTALNGLAQVNATPDGVFGLHFWAIPHGNDIRYLPPTAADLQATRLDDVKAFVHEALVNGPVEIVVVGDITVEDAIKALQTTFGALPKRQLRTAPFAGDERMPRPEESPFVLHYQGSGAQAVAMMSWRTVSMFPDLQTPRTLRVLERVLSQRLFDELRSKEGVTYTPQTQTAHSYATPGWGFLGVFANVPDAKIADFYAAVAKVVTDLKTRDVPADELARARDPLLGDAERARQNNLFWLGALAGAQTDPRILEIIRTDLADLKKVSAADLRQAAQTYLTDERSWKVMAVPQDYKLADKTP